MTAAGPNPPPRGHDEHASTGSEREVLEAFLELYRAVVVSKVQGVSEEDARRRLVPSLSTVGGILKHLRWVEVGWFHLLVSQRTGDNIRPHDRDWEFTPEPAETVDILIGDYQAACERSRTIAAAHQLEDRVPHRRMGEVSLRWIYVHLIEETARHAGQLDILREQLDGTTGFT